MLLLSLIDVEMSSYNNEIKTERKKPSHGCVIWCDWFHWHATYTHTRARTRTDTHTQTQSTICFGCDLLHAHNCPIGINELARKMQTKWHGNEYSAFWSVRYRLWKGQLNERYTGGTQDTRRNNFVISSQLKICYFCLATTIATTWPSLLWLEKTKRKQNRTISLLVFSLTMFTFFFFLRILHFFAFNSNNDVDTHSAQPQPHTHTDEFVQKLIDNFGLFTSDFVADVCYCVLCLCSIRCSFFSVLCYCVIHIHRSSCYSFYVVRRFIRSFTPHTSDSLVGIFCAVKLAIHGWCVRDCPCMCVPYVYSTNQTGNS